jgi:hypothetical protein
MCTLRDVRQHGLAAHFQRAWLGDDGLAVPLAALSHVSLRSLPESIFFHSDLPAHCAAAASHRPEIGIASPGGPFLSGWLRSKQSGTIPNAQRARAK